MRNPKAQEEVKSAMSYPVRDHHRALVSLCHRLSVRVPSFEKMFKEMARSCPDPTVVG